MPILGEPGWVIFTDLDGTLLDHTSYGWEAAKPALAALRCFRVPRVMVTSKTYAEARPIARRLGWRAPLVVENGGAIYVPAGYFPFTLDGARRAGRSWLRLACGIERKRLQKALARAAREARLEVRGFGQMSAREVAIRTGLSLSDARRARQREFDEPFVVLGGNARRWSHFARSVRRAGMQATRGSRFFHIHGNSDKGVAVRKLTAWFRRAGGKDVLTVGLGDSPNDIPLLRAVDLPVLVARPGGRYDRETIEAVPGIRRAGGIGPNGWNRAVWKFLTSQLRRL
jgi:mannosyl-3-phosphoglycerate phosphatase